MPKRNSTTDLTDKQLMFVGEYMLDLNGKQAAIRCGYSARSAEVTASQLLSIPKVRAEVDRRIARRGVKLSISAERVLAELACIAFAKGDDVVKFSKDGVEVRNSDDLSDDVLANIAEVSETVTTGEFGGSRTIRVKHHDKMAALNILAKHTGVSREKLELVGAGGGPIEVTTRSSLESKLDALGKRLGGGGGTSEPG